MSRLALLRERDLGRFGSPAWTESGGALLGVLYAMAYHSDISGVIGAWDGTAFIRRSLVMTDAPSMRHVSLTICEYI